MTGSRYFDPFSNRTRANTSYESGYDTWFNNSNWKWIASAVSKVQKRYRLLLSTGLSIHKVVARLNSPPPIIPRFMKSSSITKISHPGVGVKNRTAPVITILGLMWAYCNGKIKPNQEKDQLRDLWGQIILRNWTTRFVTTCTAIPRVCVSAQLLFMCLILTSLALEHQQVQDDDTGIMTIYQYANSGPFSIALPLLSGLRPNRRLLVLTAVILLAMESVVIQFASTILLSDVNLVVLPAGNEVTRLLWKSLAGHIHSLICFVMSFQSCYRP
ncbi:hypothetical protein K440DRAFT_644099 [Wilcoxina mikolae CBS 423.85]|nr:hypothetical protein K440DRAFT_644099 [Wilcoxina mikolae CBS 423.85]